MRTCLSFIVRHRSEPLHLCFEDRDSADRALREFTRDVDSISDGETVLIEGGRPDGREACVGFLKRDFVSVEKDSFEDEGDDGQTEAPVEDETKPLTDPDAGSGHALEAATNIVKAAAS